MREINTISDWMQEVADAIRNRDFNALERLDRISSDWMQSGQERDAQIALIESAMEIIEEVVR